MKKNTNTERNTFSAHSFQLITLITSNTKSCCRLKHHLVTHGGISPNQHSPLPSRQSVVTALARFRGVSGLIPRATASS